MTDPAVEKESDDFHSAAGNTQDQTLFLVVAKAFDLGGVSLKFPVINIITNSLELTN